jgi:hypothetical protein
VPFSPAPSGQVRDSDVTLTGNRAAIINERTDTTDAVAALTAAVGAERDFSGWLAATMAAVAAELGSVDALTAGRPATGRAHCPIR